MNNIKEYGKRVAIGMAFHYANVSYPIILNQPEMKDSIKIVRKF